MSWKCELLMKPPGAPLTEGPAWDDEHVDFTHIRVSADGHFLKAATGRVGWALYT